MRKWKASDSPHSEHERLLRELDIAEYKAIDALAHYRFAMFGYWAGIWVHLNRISGLKRSNPFRSFVQEARKKCRNDVWHVSLPAPAQLEIQA